MSIKRDVQPDSDGYVPLIAAGHKRAEFNPERDKIRIKSRGTLTYFDLADYRPKKPKP